MHLSRTIWFAMATVLAFAAMTAFTMAWLAVADTTRPSVRVILVMGGLIVVAAVVTLQDRAADRH